MFQPKKEVVSNLHESLQALIELMFDVREFEASVKEMQYDINKAPLGKLTSKQIKVNSYKMKISCKFIFHFSNTLGRIWNLEKDRRVHDKEQITGGFEFGVQWVLHAYPPWFRDESPASDPHWRRTKEKDWIAWGFRRYSSMLNYLWYFKLVALFTLRVYIAGSPAVFSYFSLS